MGYVVPNGLNIIFVLKTNSSRVTGDYSMSILEAAHYVERCVLCMHLRHDNVGGFRIDLVKLLLL